MMEFCMHSEYPTILRKTEDGVQGTWYMNCIKPIELQHDELRKMGKGEEVYAVRSVFRDATGAEYRTWDDLNVEQRTELGRRTRQIIPSSKDYNSLHCVKVEGAAYFDPLVSNQWGAEGEMSIEFEIEHDPDFDVARYRIILDGPLVKGLKRMNKDLVWEDTHEINIPYDEYIYKEIIWLNNVKHTPAES